MEDWHVDEDDRSGPAGSRRFWVTVLCFAVANLGIWIGYDRLVGTRGRAAGGAPIRAGRPAGKSAAVPISGGPSTSTSPAKPTIPRRDDFTGRCRASGFGTAREADVYPGRPAAQGNRVYGHAASRPAADAGRLSAEVAAHHVRYTAAAAVRELIKLLSMSAIGSCLRSALLMTCFPPRRWPI